MSDNSGMPSSNEAIPAVPFASILGVCSLLHETVGNVAAWSSQTALLRGKPVVRHAVERLARVPGIGGVAVLCWDEQAQNLEVILQDIGAHLIPHGPARRIPHLNAVSTAQTWADGWRGGLLQTIPQDRGFFAPTAAAVARAVGAEALFLVDSSFALLDEALCGWLIAHAADRPGHDLYFTAAAPGLAGLLISAARVGRLAEANGHPGSALHYQPESPCLDPIAADYCLHAPFQLTRTLHDFRVDDDRTLAVAEAVLTRDPRITTTGLIEAFDAGADLTRITDLTIELTTARRTKPIWLNAAEPDAFDLDSLGLLLEQALAENRQLRITFGRLGDPLCHPDWRQALEIARRAGATSIHIETDLLCETAAIAGIAALTDLVSVHLPAVTAATYERVMGTDGYAQVTRNLAHLIALGGKRNSGLPLIVPTFVKTTANLDEMEPWYDGWLTQVGSAVVRGPDAFDNAPPADIATARMIRSERRPRELVVTAAGELKLGRNRMESISTLGRRPLRDRLEKNLATQVVARDKEAA